MVNSIREAEAFPMNDTVISTMYKHQKVVVSAMFTQVAKKLGLRRSAFPEVATVDGFQSCESRMVSIQPSRILWALSKTRIGAIWHAHAEWMSSSLWGHQQR